MGHEAGLTNVHWSPLPSVLHKTPVLLSTASDNSLVIWTPSSQGIWIPSQRFGTLGGRGLAFYGAIWGKDGKSVMAGGWNGGWERWVREENQAEDLAYELQRWEAKPGLAGHYGDVQSVAWDPKGDYLVSVR
jgi:elongator complex protein 2